MENNFEKDMEVFGFGQHQDFLTYGKRLEEFGYTLIDVENYVKNYMKAKEREIAEVEGKVIKKLCPVCNFFMRLLPLNFNPATLTGDDSQSVWFCTNQACMNTIYNKESVTEIIRKGGT